MLFPDRAYPSTFTELKLQRSEDGRIFFRIADTHKYKNKIDTVFRQSEDLIGIEERTGLRRAVRFFVERKLLRLGRLDGISFLGAETNSGRCGEYVFSRIMHEPWAKDIDIEGHPLWGHTYDFLASKGYQPVTDTPEEGDIVAYGWEEPQTHTLQEAEHFGIYAQGQATSKFGGYLWQHDIDVPLMYGDFGVFFRKQNS